MEVVEMTQWQVGDVMTRDVVTVTAGTPYRVIIDVLMRRRVSAAPVVDELGRVLGVVSETDLLHQVEFSDQDPGPRLFESRRHRRTRAKAGAATAADLMTAPAHTALATTSVTAAARRMAENRVKRLPLVDELGRIVGIVTRSDLLKVHLRGDPAILAEIEKDVLGRTLLLEPGTVTVTVRDGAVTLDGVVDRVSSADLAVRLTRRVAGVVTVTDRLRPEFDDTALSRAAFPIIAA
ncbi:CBS domain-containing protein [Catenuloplanes atrovinosus]|uniref:CBS-domain-containing membrane protein n=1 Tax=Catenuloplanes atrovinosus TaxID=137266 RepID=A0AAE3YNQ9_9ACTN|nr:CBS domain-containing protein [Catenuloplanes atrovinosus]MDR7275761.1 CBS-domain-containing membrane protein [Catenuloplanes atrovinosus]